MSGSDKISWDRYLNGGTSQYNFKYRGEEPPSMANPPVPVGSMPNTNQPNPNTNPVKPNTGIPKQENLSQIPKRKNQTGGKRRAHLKKKRGITRRRK
jgi:hypothetical protein